MLYILWPQAKIEFQNQRVFCFPQQTNTCFWHQTSTSSTGLRFTPTLKMTRQAPAPVTAMSLSAVQMVWKKKVNQRRLQHYQWMERWAVETQCNTPSPATPHRACRQTVHQKRQRAPHMFKCKVHSQQSTNCFII